MMIAKRHQIEEFKHLIIDEAFNVAIDLLYEFLEAFPGKYRITFIGDHNQLPPIGCGFGEQLMNSGKVPVYRLTTNHRFGITPDGTDGILINASKIIQGIDPEEPEEFAFEQASNFTLMAGGVDMVNALVAILHKQGVPYNKVTIITPYNKELMLLNNMCQAIYIQEKMA